MVIRGRPGLPLGKHARKALTWDLEALRLERELHRELGSEYGEKADQIRKASGAQRGSDWTQQALRPLHSVLFPYYL